MNNLIKKILVSEKSFTAATGGKYSFIVDKAMRKESIAKAVEELFAVSVLSVNSMNYKGKVKSTKRKMGTRNNFKKVILSLKPGQKIDLFEIEGDEKENKKEKSKEVKAEKKKMKATAKGGVPTDDGGKNKDVEVTIKSK